MLNYYMKAFLHARSYLCYELVRTPSPKFRILFGSHMKIQISNHLSPILHPTRSPASILISISRISKHDTKEGFFKKLGQQRRVFFTLFKASLSRRSLQPRLYFRCTSEDVLPDLLNFKILYLISS